MAYTKTTWEDYPSTNSIINATKLNKIEDGIEQASERNIISVGIDSVYTLTTTGQHILSPNKIIEQVGDTNKLYLGTNGVYIGPGVEHIVISGSIQVHTATSLSTSSFNMAIYENGQEKLLSMNSGAIANTNYSKSIAPQLVSVNEGDYFQFGYYGSNGDYVNDNSSRTYITIEVID